MDGSVEVEFLGFDDVVIVPGRSKVEPGEVDITGYFTRSIALRIPASSSPMDTVTEYRLATTLARAGAIGVIHRNMPIEEQARHVRLVKEAEPDLSAEIPKIDPGVSAAEALRLLKSRGAGAAVVVGPEGPLGYIIATGLDPRVWLEKAEALRILNMTVKPEPILDDNGRLRVAAAVSPFDLERAKALERAGVDVLVVDVAHLHNDNAISALAKMSKEVSVEIVAGNLGTREGVLDVISRVEDVAGLRVGIASGSICITGEVAGASVPTLAAVMQARSALEELGLMGKIPIIADGGIRSPGDAAKAIIAGASSVMSGRLFAGTEEAAAPTIRVGDKLYKPYRGMGSRGAMEKRFSADRYARPSKAIEEGVEGLVPYQGPALKVLADLAAGLQAALGYAGAKSVSDAWRARLARVSPATRGEIKPHDILLG